LVNHYSWTEPNERNKPGRKEKNIQERRKGISSNLSDIRLLFEGVVEQSGSTHILSFGVTGTVFTFTPLGSTGNVESHLNELVHRGRILFLAAARRAIRCGELDRNLVLSGKIGVGDLRERNLERGLVGDVEVKFLLGELGLPPVPSLEGVLTVLEVDLVVSFQSRLDAVEVLDFPEAIISNQPGN